jgi:uncharacterized OsmC-like protein
MSTKNSTTTAPKQTLNGLDVDFLRATIDAVKAEPALAKTHWSVSTHWRGGTRSDTRVESYAIGGQEIRKDFTIRADEPLELGGTNRDPNPQELLLAALNACMTVGYVAACTLEGIEVRDLRIETSGDIDLRGFLGLDPDVKAGYDALTYTVFLSANATPAQLERVHDFVCRTSPNRFNVAQPIRLETRLVVA